MAVYDLQILENTRLLPHVVSMRLDAGPVLRSGEAVRPGQFFQVLCGGATYLRRPVSVCDCTVDPEPVVRLVFEIKGEGTRLLAQKRAGETVNVLGPLGNGFGLIPGPADLIGGGLGVCPLLYLTRSLRKSGRRGPDAPVRVFLGFRNRDAVFLAEDFRKLGADVTVCTDDGSFGEPGSALAAYERLCAVGRRPDMLYTCGPQPMMDAVVRYADARGILYQESREERMGCGVGACLVCACKMQDGSMGHVCKDGPVFGSGMAAFGGKVAYHA